MPTRTPPEAELATLRVEEVSTLSGLERLRAEWASLWQRAASATPFQSPEWLTAWASELCGDAQLWVLAMRSGDRLVGLAPFVLHRPPGEDRRQVLLLGTGVSDYLDTLAEPGLEGTVGAMVYNHLDERGDLWDHGDFQQLRPESPLLAVDFGPTRAAPTEPQEPCPALHAGPDGWPVPPNFARKLAYERRRLERETRLRFVTADERDFDRSFDALLRLHGARWHRRGQSGVLSDAAVARFHTHAARGLLARGVLRLHLAYDGPRPIAALYGFLHRRRAYYYLGGFDPDYEKRGAGNQIVWHALLAAEAEGATTFDFLRGQEPYKYRWGAVDQPTFRRQLLREHRVCG